MTEPLKAVVIRFGHIGTDLMLMTLRQLSRVDVALDLTRMCSGTEVT